MHQQHQHNSAAGGDATVTANVDLAALLRVVWGDRDNRCEFHELIELLRVVIHGHRWPTTSDVVRRLDEIAENVQTIYDVLQNLSGGQTDIMATMQQWTDALAKVNDATSRIATVLDAVRRKVAELETNAGISASDEASVLTLLEQSSKALEAMGKTPEEPVPVTPPTP